MSRNSPDAPRASRSRTAVAMIAPSNLAIAVRSASAEADRQSRSRAISRRLSLRACAKAPRRAHSDQPTLPGGQVDLDQGGRASESAV